MLTRVVRNLNVLMPRISHGHGLVQRHGQLVISQRHGHTQEMGDGGWGGRSKLPKSQTSNRTPTVEM